jgi:hypothetical protein
MYSADSVTYTVIFSYSKLVEARSKTKLYEILGRLRNLQHFGPEDGGSTDL